MNISDMIEFVNTISSFELEKCDNEDSIAVSEIREDEVKLSPCQMEKQVTVSKVEGV